LNMRVLQNAMNEETTGVIVAFGGMDW
jgi:hypothetical protein